MTNELAIRILTGDVLGTTEQTQEAIEIAVKALSNTNGETIYRQDAIDLLQKWSDGYKYIETETELAIKDFQHLPSAQPEHIKGDWIEIASSNHTYKCSVCGRLLVNITDGKNNVAKNYPYCHCGAIMVR